jgi:hypothetical protein
MLNEHFIYFDVLSHMKMLDADILTFVSTFIILKEEYCSTIIADIFLISNNAILLKKKSVTRTYVHKQYTIEL